MSVFRAPAGLQQVLINPGEIICDVPGSQFVDITDMLHPPTAVFARRIGTGHELQQVAENDRTFLLVLKTESHMQENRLYRLLPAFLVFLALLFAHCRQWREENGEQIGNSLPAPATLFWRSQSISQSIFKKRRKANLRAVRRNGDFGGFFGFFTRFYRKILVVVVFGRVLLLFSTG